MGLDQYILSRTADAPWVEDYNPEIFTEEVYFRKNNAFHGWVLKTYHAHRDFCGEIEIRLEKRDLTELVNTLNQLTRLKVSCRNPSHLEQMCQGLYPTTQGFLFGDYNYGETYWGDVELTIMLITNLLCNWDDSRIYTYQCSW